MLCSAPFNSILVDPDKSVRPCCAWQAKKFGNLNENSIEEIYASDYVKQVQQDMLNNVYSEGCQGCKQREIETGTSVRLNVYNNSDIQINFNETNKIEYLEYNATNTCNLSCLMCLPSFSSNAVEFYKEYGWAAKEEHSKGIFPDWKIHPINLEKAEHFVTQVNWSQLKTLWLKGGEPFLNKENIVLLNHLKSIDILKNIDVWITTNGTIVNENILELLEYAKSVTFAVSIDGTEKINKYIRFGYGNPEISSLNNIENSIKKLLSLSNLKHIGCSPTIQVLNIFDIINFNIFWKSKIHSLNTKKIASCLGLQHFVMYPRYLNLRTLPNNFRTELIKNFEYHGEEYLHIINLLKQDYLGTTNFLNLLKFIKWIDKTRPESILHIEPRFQKLFSKYNFSYDPTNTDLVL